MKLTKLIKEDDISKLYDKLVSIIAQMKSLVIKYKETVGEEQLVIVNQLKTLTKQKKEIEYKLDNAVVDKDAHVELVDLVENKKVGAKLSRVIELMTKKLNKENKYSGNKQLVKEYGKKQALNILEELFDTYIIQTDLMIDEYYGKTDAVQFKKMWSSQAKDTSIKFTNIIKNMRA